MNDFEWAKAPEPEEGQFASFLEKDLNLNLPYNYFIRDELQKYIPQVSFKTKVEMRENERRQFVRQLIHEDPKFDVEPKTIRETRTLLIPHSSGWRNFWRRLKFLFVPNVPALRELFHYDTYTVEVANPKSTMVSLPRSITIEYPFVTYGFRLNTQELRLRCAYNPFADVLIIAYAQVKDLDYGDFRW